jgi:hypothetical protein
MDALRLEPGECAIIADFYGTDFDHPATLAGVIESAIEWLEEAGGWHSIIFQGSSYPETNPADPGSSAVVPRNEWRAWRTAVHFDKDTDARLVFGDYAADCAKINFGKSRGKPICHYRYATPKDWFVIRGETEGSNERIMREVCQRLVESGHFAGRGFSMADDYIYRTSKGHAGPGAPARWREVNTTHHITRVVRDIGSMKNMTFSDSVVSDMDEGQKSLFSDAY